MNKPKKQGTFVSAFIKKDAYEMLLEHCEVTGQSKTKALERAIESYCSKKSDTEAEDADNVNESDVSDE